MMLGIALLFALLRLFSAIWFVLKFYGYRLELHHDLLHVRCGLFTQVSATVPRGRIQLISVQRSWFARKIGLASIRIETAGGNRKGEDMATSVGRRWFVPVLLDRDVERILGVLDQRVVFDEAALNWQPLARDATKRMRRPFIAASIVLFVVGLYLQPYWGWCVGLVVAIMGNWYVKKKSKSRRYARTDWGVVFRSGTWIQKCSMTFFEKIQSARLDQTPLDRRWGMQTLRLDTASAGPADHSICISLLDSEHASAEFKNLKNAIAMHSKYGH
jgi:putative membrane protein